MDNNSGALILLIVLIVSAFLLIVLKLAQFVNHFSREKQYLLTEMNRAADYNEYRYWRRELRCLYLCLIPFVTERNVMKVYPVFFHRAKHATKEKRSDGFMHILAPSMLAICICAICLCGASWAWFTASSSAGTAKIQAASYTVSVTAIQGESQLSANTAENGASIFALEADKEYTIEITPTGNATTGYCKVNFENKDYYTAQCASATLSFTVYASDSGTLTVTPEWGTCAIEGDKIGNGLTELGTAPSANGTPSDTTSVEAAPKAVASAIESTQTELEQASPDSTPAEAEQNAAE